MRSRIRHAKVGPACGKRIAVVTGTRAEYGLLQSTMQAIAAKRNLTLQVIATGMHLLKRFGHTIDDIRSDGWKIDATVPMQKGNDDPLDQALGLANGVKGIARFVQRANTDIVLVLGDRIEALAGALAATTTGRIVAHVHGGDVAPGDFDDPTRHCITKLAHVHLAATRQAARRIRRMGEREDHIHVTGAPGLDRLTELLKERRENSTPSDRVLVVQHASGRPPERENRLMRAILRAVQRCDLPATILYPNTDRGCSGIVEAIEQFHGANNTVATAVHASLPRDAYLGALIDARVLIGNSSSGIIEAATAGTAVVNVGNRQNGRQPAGRWIIQADESHASIHQSLRQALLIRPRPKGNTPYGRGGAGRRIADILARLRLTAALRDKRISY